MFTLRLLSGLPDLGPFRLVIESNDPVIGLISELIDDLGGGIGLALRHLKGLLDQLSDSRQILRIITNYQSPRKILVCRKVSSYFFRLQLVQKALQNYGPGSYMFGVCDYFEAGGRVNV